MIIQVADQLPFTFPPARLQTTFLKKRIVTFVGKGKSLILSMALSGTLNMVQFTREPNTTYSEMMDGDIDNVNQANENTSAGDLNFGIVFHTLHLKKV